MIDELVKQPTKIKETNNLTDFNSANLRISLDALREAQKTQREVIKLSEEIDKKVREIESIKSLTYIGFIVLIAIVSGLVWSFTSEKVTADNELTKAIDMLQAQGTVPLLQKATR